VANYEHALNSSKKKKVGDWIREMKHEQSSGSGPHFGKSSKLVHKNRPDIIAAIAYSKVKNHKG